MTMTTNTGATTSPVTELLSDGAFRRYAVAGLIYAGISAALVLSANVLSSPEADRPAVPVSSRMTSFADDLAALGSVLPPVSEHRFGSGYVVFEPAAAEPDGTVGLSTNHDAGE